jgi:hypothetical protein
MKRSHDVFGMSNEVLPDSYVNRGALDEHLTRLLGRRSHIALRGPSKCGKSWLRQRVLADGLVVQCRFGNTTTDIYTGALSILGIHFEVDRTTTVGLKGTAEAQVEAGAALLAKVDVKLGLEGSRDTAKTSAPVGRNIHDLRYVANLIIESGRRLVIEDVHYLSHDQRLALAYDLKALWDYGCFAMVVGVWGLANFFVRLNGELSGRMEEISIEWGPDDLRLIIERGSTALKLAFSREIQNKTIVDAFGNAGLLQRLVLGTVDEAKIFEEQSTTTPVTDIAFYEAAAMAVADQLNGVYLKFGERVASGIRTRKDATSIYAHAMAVILDAPDPQHMSGITLDEIFAVAHSRQQRIQKANLKSVLEKIDGLQVDKDGRGLVVTYDVEEECVRNVDRQLLFYRKYRTVSWPWEQLIAEAEGK